MSLKGCLILLPLLAVTWLLGFLQLNSDSPVMSYAFVLLSCCQVIMIATLKIQPRNSLYPIANSVHTIYLLVISLPQRINHLRLSFVITF